MSAAVLAILIGFVIFVFERFQLGVQWIVDGLIALALMAAWTFWESLEEHRTDDED
ncbi:hypothetical protein [Rhizobium sp. BK376]|uniref:hypothetical protein n=1 Tax=Rhizobium sp. BK376 TaxID=2512149 RepID=UPI0010E6E3EB|nr:hypothetical protein [Rhizobium sp. BK376]TCR75629.1 hypothetical protein EV561_12268 [Rhizobium sp. BK376]